MTINIGSAAISRAYGCPASLIQTFITLRNPSTINGKLTQVDFWLKQAVAGYHLWVGIFYNTSGSTYVCRSSQDLGVFTTTGFHSVSGLTLAVSTGDFIGFCISTGYGNTEIATDSSYSWVLTTPGNHINPGNSANYSDSSNTDISLLGYVNPLIIPSFGSNNASKLKANGLI